MDVIQRKIDFPIWDIISGAGADSDVYMGEQWKVLKVYGAINPELLIKYHQIQEYYAQRWNQIVDTPSWILSIGVLPLWDVYYDEQYWCYTTPDYIAGWRLTIWWTIAGTQDRVIEALWVNKIGTNGLIDYNSVVTHRDGKSQHLTVTDLGWKIWNFVEYNDHVI